MLLLLLLLLMLMLLPLPLLLLLPLPRAGHAGRVISFQDEMTLPRSARPFRSRTKRPSRGAFSGSAGTGKGSLARAARRHASQGCRDGLWWCAAGGPPWTDPCTLSETRRRGPGARLLPLVG